MNPCAASNLDRRSHEKPLAAALLAESLKVEKYADERKAVAKHAVLEPVFYPIAVEAFGSVGPLARKFFQKVSGCKSVAGSDPFLDNLRNLSQLLSVTLQKCNAAMIAQCNPCL